MSNTPKVDEFLNSDKMDEDLAALIGRSRLKALTEFSRKLELECADLERENAELKKTVDFLNRARQRAKDDSKAIINCKERENAGLKELVERIKGELALCFSEIDRLASENAELKKLVEQTCKAAQIYRAASVQPHDSHWDGQMTGGANCPECLRASKLRREADALMRCSTPRLKRQKGG